jgi:DNA-binding GntR family transcriptional regulator
MPTADSSQATYARIAQALRDRIEGGDFSPGDLLPSEAALAEEFGVARSTVRQALKELERDSLVVGQVGRGRRVAGTPVSLGPARYEKVAASLLEELRDGEPGTQLPSEQELAARFGVARGTVRQALAHLESLGLVRSVPGRGRFISSSDDADPVSRYEKVADGIRAAIQAGEYRAGSRLPGEHEFSQRYGVARITVRRALELLQQEGLVSVVPSKGRYVSGEAQGASSVTRLAEPTGE